MNISKLITNNVRDSFVEAEFKQQGIYKSRDEKGMSLNEWLNTLLESERASEEDINAALYKQLFYGERRFGRLYYIEECRMIRYAKDWKPILEKHSFKTLGENRIIQTIPAENKKILLAATDFVGQDGDLKRVELLFVYYVKVSKLARYFAENIFSYIPVIIDLENNTLFVRVENCNGIEEGERADDQLDQIVKLIQDELHIKFVGKSSKEMSCLYNMCTDLFEQFIKCLPSYEQVLEKEADIPQLVNDLLKGVDLNSAFEEDGFWKMNPFLIDVSAEIFKLLQQIFLLDYFDTHDVMSVLKGLKQYVARIKFSDQSNLDASLVSEKNHKSVFDAKTFMSVRNSIDMVKEVRALAVTFPRNITGKRYTAMEVKYAVTDAKFLQIHVLNSWYCTKNDYEEIVELYKYYYEQNDVEQTDQTNKGPAA